MYVLAGLGNPGSKYSNTRHNAGFDAIDFLCGKFNTVCRKDEFMALTGRTVIEGENVLFVKPQTFMNKSGESIERIISYYKVDPKENLIVLVDDIMLDAGRMRIRKGGSAGGHNGLKSIIECTGTDEFKRIRLGVGKLENGADMVDHVLSKLPDPDRGRLEKIFEDVSGAISLIIKGEFDAAMNRYNGIQEQ